MPELAAASTGTVRPTQQCGAHCARRLLLDHVLVSVRPQSPRELPRLLLLSLTPLIAGRSVQVSRTEPDPLLAARL